MIQQEEIVDRHVKNNFAFDNQCKRRIDEVTVEVIDDSKGMRWRLIVNKKESDWHSYYPGIMVFEGFGVASAYWDGTFKEFVPFRIEYPSESLTEMINQENK